jgi:hypothetical protein
VRVRVSVRLRVRVRVRVRVCVCVWAACERAFTEAHVSQYVLVEALKAEHAVTQSSTRAVANVAGGCVFHLPADPDEDPPAILASSKECPPDGERSQRFTIQVRVLRGLPGRQKVHTLELVVPVTSVATKDDAVSCSPPSPAFPLHDAYMRALQCGAPGSRSRLFFLHSSSSDSVSLCTQVRIMFRKLKESFEKTNAELREELALMHLQCNNRVFFGVGHSVSRLVPALKTRTIVAGDQCTFKPVPKTEVGAFRPQAHAASILTVIPSRPKHENTWDCQAGGYEENWVQVSVNWTPQVRGLTVETFAVSSDGALVVQKVSCVAINAC